MSSVPARGGVFPWWEPGVVAQDEGGSATKTVKFGDSILLKDTVAGKYLSWVSDGGSYFFTPSASTALEAVPFTIDDHNSPGSRNHAVSSSGTQNLILTTGYVDTDVSSDPNGYRSITLVQNMPAMVSSTSSNAVTGNSWSLQKTDYKTNTPFIYGDKVQLFNGNIVTYNCTTAPCAGQDTSAYTAKIQSGTSPFGGTPVFEILNGNGIIPRLPQGSSSPWFPIPPAPPSSPSSPSIPSSPLTRPWAPVVPLPKASHVKAILGVIAIALVLLLGAAGLYKYVLASRR